MEKISIRQAPFAKSGLSDLIEWVEKTTNREFKNFEMVEIGSFVGDSTEIFAQRCSLINCVDPWKNGYDESDPSSFTWPMSQIEAQFDELRKIYPNIIKYKMKSEFAALDFKDQSLDFIYIDGNHLYDFVKKDILAWLPKLKKPGVIAGHDYAHKLAPGVKPAVDELLGVPDKRFPETSWAKYIL